MKSGRWDCKSVESMYDKTLLGIETQKIRKHIRPGSTVCDAGCGEGEGTLEYAKVSTVEAFDISMTRLAMALERLNGLQVTLRQHDALEPLEGSFDVVISQRLLINLASWEEQKRAISNLGSCVSAGGLLVLSEGSVEGVRCLNWVRALYGLPEIPVPLHNVFISDGDLLAFCKSIGLSLESSDDLGAYYLLTRGIQPALINKYDWNSSFNRASAEIDLPAGRFSRLKIWAFRKGV